MADRRAFSADEAHRAAEQVGIDWASAPFDIEQFRMGMDVELVQMLCNFYFADDVTDTTLEHMVQRIVRKEFFAKE